jgi:hypothetical protein
LDAGRQQWRGKARPVKVRNKAASLSGGGTFLVSDTVVN